MLASCSFEGALLLLEIASSPLECLGPLLSKGKAGLRQIDQGLPNLAGWCLAIASSAFKDDQISWN